MQRPREGCHAVAEAVQSPVLVKEIGGILGVFGDSRNPKLLMRSVVVTLRCTLETGSLDA